jgi:16S rRNA (guanine(527)-N(7))-methyltransferase RsmG
MREGISQPIVNAESFQKAFAVSRETVARLETYAALLKRWQKTINLVAPSTLDDIWHRHFADSAQLFRMASPPPTSPSPAHREAMLRIDGERAGVRGAIARLPIEAPSSGPILGRLRAGRPPSPQGEKGNLAGIERTAPVHFLDVGSGAGFPGLVLAIMAAETGHVRHTLIESDTRKAAFLREVARETGVVVEIVADRIESPRTAASVGEVNCVTARALAPLPRLLPLVAPYFGAETAGLFLKGRDVVTELEEAARSWAFQSELFASLTDREGRVVRLAGLRQKR